MIKQTLCTYTQYSRQKYRQKVLILQMVKNVSQVSK